ncbi:MAG: creatininase family protein [Pseudomonadota bacterium]
MVEVKWSRLKAQDLRRLAERDAVVILPVGSIEQHGPHLPTDVDSRLGMEVACRTARRVAETQPTVVAPMLWTGLSDHHMAFGGTFTIRPATMMALFADLLDSLIVHGFRKVLIQNSHGGNAIAIKHVVQTLAPTSPATLVASTYFEEAGPAISALLEDQTQLRHAEEAETSMMLAIAPELVDDSDLGSLNEGEGPEVLRAGRASYRWRPFKHATASGIRGNPTRASAEKGERIFEVCVAAMAALILDPATWAPCDDRRGDSVAGVPLRR